MDSVLCSVLHHLALPPFCFTFAATRKGSVGGWIREGHTLVEGVSRQNFTLQQDTISEAERLDDVLEPYFCFSLRLPVRCSARNHAAREASGRRTDEAPAPTGCAQEKASAGEVLHAKQECTAGSSQQCLGPQHCPTTHVDGPCEATNTPTALLPNEGPEFATTSQQHLLSRHRNR